MKQKISPAFYAVFAVFLACLTGLLLGSCSLTDSCTVVMEEVYDAAEPVKLTIRWNGTTAKADLMFEIDGIPYGVKDIPTVSDPVYRLETEGDGIREASLHLAYDEADVCELHMYPEEGGELIFTCEKEEMAAFYAWVRSN